MTITAIDPWAPLPTLHVLAERAHLERIAHEKEQLRLLRLIDAWDRLTIEQKWDQYDIEANTDGLKTSRYAEMPGFTPKHCAGCASYVFLDFREDPAGACPFDPAHPIAAVRPLALAG